MLATAEAHSMMPDSSARRGLPNQRDLRSREPLWAWNPACTHRAPQRRVAASKEPHAQSLESKCLLVEEASSFSRGTSFELTAFKFRRITGRQCEQLPRRGYTSHHARFVANPETIRQSHSRKPYNPSTARCAAKISFIPASAKSISPLNWLREKLPFSAVACVSMRPPSAVITTFISTSACESSS